MLEATVLTAALLFCTIQPDAYPSDAAGNLSAPDTPCKLKLAHKTNPKLPKHLRGVRSALIVHVQVRPDGSVTEAEVVKGTGNQEVDRSVVNAIKSDWRYKPMRADCIMVEDLINIKLAYRDHGVIKPGH